MFCLFCSSVLSESYACDLEGKSDNKMLAVPKDNSSYWKTDYMLSTFGNKQGVQHWQHGMGKKQELITSDCKVSYLVSVSLIFLICQMG